MTLDEARTNIDNAVRKLNVANRSRDPEQIRAAETALRVAHMKYGQLVHAADCEGVVIRFIDR